MDADELAKLQLEAWKTTVQVQQHFNDIAMKIRSLAITVLTAVLAAAAVAIKDGTKLDVFGVSVPLGSALLFVGAVTWALFYFVDQIWYHRLLLGAVKHGLALEKKLAAYGDGFGLTTAIKKESPHQFKLFGVNLNGPMHSSTKLSFFYGCVELLLILATLLSAVGTIDNTEPEKKSSPGVESAWGASVVTGG